VGTSALPMLPMLPTIFAWTDKIALARGIR
jgi:hypothetical protein